jgi:hypothetical protein
MSLVLVLGLLLVVILQIEIASSRTYLNFARTRLASDFAIQIASGQLQRCLKYDQRVNAPAGIIGLDCEINHRSWSGIWQTNALEKSPVWLVSGKNPQPELPSLNSFEFRAGYDHEKDNSFNGPLDIPPVCAPWEKIDARTEIAWWVEDHGIQIPLERTPGVWDALVLGATLPYLDYSKPTLQLSQSSHDPTFDYFETPKMNNKGTSLFEEIKNCVDKRSFESITPRLASEMTPLAFAQFNEFCTIRNAFVLLNTKEGGLKKDLSFLKTLDLGQTTAKQLEILYADADQLVNRSLARLVQTRQPLNRVGNPISYGILPKENSTTAENPSFSLSPILTECLFSMGLAVDASDPESDLYLVNKCYLELWNPYTISIRIGDPNLPLALGYSDLEIKIENLPRYTLTNRSTGQSISAQIPNQSYLWSDYAPPKKLRPGMVFQKTLPQDACATGVGTRRTPLAYKIKSKASDSIDLSLYFNRQPVVITLKALNINGSSKTLFTAQIKNYPNTKIYYQSGTQHRTHWFHRNFKSPNAQSGMNHGSLEQNGYAFGFRFKLLDQTQSDWERLFKEYEFRKDSIKVDLQKWNYDDAWDYKPLLPYDFRLNNNNCDPGNFNPTLFFSSQDLFHYETSSGSVGRRDRIIRLLDTPTAEKITPDNLRTLIFENNATNALGTSHAKKINALYDRYFFSTLPNPETAHWDGKQTLLNSRLKPIHQTDPPILENTMTAEKLILRNGFNLNSIYPKAWAAVLSGKNFPAETLMMRYEMGSTSTEIPEWYAHIDPLKHVYFNLGQTAILSQTEKPKNPEYSLLDRTNDLDYPNGLKTGSINWRNKRQHPAFIQSVREITTDEITKLSHAIVAQLKSYYATMGHPPPSLAEFLNAGLLQNAIDSVPTLNLRLDGKDRVPPSTPSYFSQSTLMTALSPFAFLHSDTFTIHVAARIRDPVSGIVLCETQDRKAIQHSPSISQKKTDEPFIAVK